MINNITCKAVLHVFQSFGIFFGPLIISLAALVCYWCLELLLGPHRNKFFETPNGLLFGPVFVFPAKQAIGCKNARRLCRPHTSFDSSRDRLTIRSFCELWGNPRWMGVRSTLVCKDEIVHNSPDIIPSFFAPFINASTRFLCQLCSIFVTDKSLLANNARSFHVLKTRIVSLNNEEKNLSARLKGLISVLMPTHRIETCVDSV